MSLESEYLGAFEEHSAQGIRAALEAGASAVERIKGKLPIDILIEMYTRSARFAECLRVMLDAGAVIDDPVAEAVLLDDVEALQRILKTSQSSLQRKLSLPCAYTRCRGVSALHVSAEYNSVACARILIDAGFGVNVRAEIDRDGFGGETPFFHAVNSYQNFCRPVMELLVDAGADLDVRVTGLIWGASLPWETVVFDVTPISYAQCGLYRQFQRSESDVYSNIEYLFRKRYLRKPRILNVPNRYLFGSAA